MRISLKEAAKITGGTVVHGTDITFNGVSYDSRQIANGQLFAAVKGEHADGHDFAKAAVENGGSAVLAERDPFSGESVAPVLIVKDSVQALQAMAHDCRSRFSGKVIGLTGTAGKTTTKELLANILSVNGKTFRSPMNLNTQIGISTSILSADGDEMFWVLEAGISHPNDMDELGSMIEPDLAIILNVGAGHSLGLGDKGTAYYKARLLRYRRPSHPALISDDYPDLKRETLGLPDIAFFSTQNPDVPFYAKYIGTDEAGKGLYALKLDGAHLEVRTELAGEYAAENIIAAAAAAYLLGLSPDEIAVGVQSCGFHTHRFSRSQINGWNIIDDSYNANPLSMQKMLLAAREIAGKGELVCMLGAMGELGEVAEKEHERLGELLASLPCSAVFWQGNYAEQVKHGLDTMHASSVFKKVDSPEEFLEKFLQWKNAGNVGTGTVFFKGSRVNYLENNVKIFSDWVSHVV